MPMGIVSDKDFEQELNRNGNKKPTIENEPHPGRSKGDNNVPEGLRKIIGEEANINGRQDALALARMFGVSDSSVSAYAKGATSTDSYRKPNNKIADYIKNRKERITKKTLHKLTSALDSITEDKLQALGPRHAAAIARDMSAIVKNMEPEKSSSVNGDQQNNQFIFYAPQFMKEQDFEVIEVKEQ